MRRSLALLSVATALVAGSTNDYEVSGVIGNVQHLGKSHPLSDELSYGIRAGARFAPWLIGELGYDRVQADYTKISSKDTALNRYSMNGLFEYTRYNTYIPYFILGGGYENVSSDIDNYMESEWFANYGAGMRFVLDKNFHMKLEGKHAIRRDGRNSFLSSINFVIPFGYAEPARKAEPVKAVEPKPVAKVEEPKDSDKDGVFDNKDKCPDTPKGFSVDTDGCEVKYTFIVQFDFDKYAIKPEFVSDVNNFVAFMKKNQGVKAEIGGHTDSVGSDAYNMTLSDKRAKTVMNEVVKQGINQDRVSYKGYGESQPVADNKNAEGRYKNRRIEAKLIHNMEK